MGPANIEDCAHTMGATRTGRKGGNFAMAGCFSTQAYNHMNSGEGDLLAADDGELMARVLVNSSIHLTFTLEDCEHIIALTMTCLTTYSDEGLFGGEFSSDTSPARTESTAFVPAMAQIDAETSEGSDR